MKAQSILFLTKANDPFCEIARDFLERNFAAVKTVYTERNKPLSPEIQYFDYHWIISYLCRNVIRKWMIEKARLGAINFHPAPPEYPGAGSTNIALYDGARYFGVTCHHVIQQVDSGQIIDVEYFPVYETDTVWSLTKKAHVHLLHQFYRIMDLIICDVELSKSDYEWTRAPYRLADFHALRIITRDMDGAEIARRIRATTYPGGDGPYIEIAGRRFEIKC